MVIVRVRPQGSAWLPSARTSDLRSLRKKCPPGGSWAPCRACAVICLSPMRAPRQTLLMVPDHRKVPLQLAERVRGVITRKRPADSGRTAPRQAARAKFAVAAAGAGNTTLLPVQYILVTAPQTVAHVLNVSIGLLVTDTGTITASHTLLQCLLAGAAVVLLLGLLLLYRTCSRPSRSGSWRSCRPPPRRP